MSKGTFDYQDYRNRYAQHVMFYEAGVSKREKVFGARVAIVGLGAIAIEAARLLAIAGVRLLRFIHWEPADAAAPDSGAQTNAAEYLPQGLGAVQALAEANPQLAVEVVDAAQFANFEDLLRDVDLILYDNTDSRRCPLVSQTARRLKKPWLYAEARGGSGMTVNIIPGETACIDCVKSQLEVEAPGLNYAPTVTDLIARTISQVQAVEALKILGESPSVSREVYCFDVNRFGYTLTVTRNGTCPSCQG
jgi:adenylyltransferase/sulfurtransferase